MSWLFASGAQSIGVSALAQFSQFSSVVQSCPTLCDPMNCSMPGLPVHHHLPELRSLQSLFGRFEKKKKKEPCSHIFSSIMSLSEYSPSNSLFDYHQFPSCFSHCKTKNFGRRMGWRVMKTTL